DHRRTRLRDARNTGALARPLDEEAEHVAVAHRVALLPHRLAVRLAAADRDRAEDADELPERGHAVRLDLGDEVCVPRARDAEARDVAPRELITREDAAAAH